MKSYMLAKIYVLIIHNSSESCGCEGFQLIKSSNNRKIIQDLMYELINNENNEYEKYQELVKLSPTPQLERLSWIQNLKGPTRELFFKGLSQKILNNYEICEVDFE